MPGRASQQKWSSIVEAISGIVGADLSGPKAMGLWIFTGFGLLARNPLTLLFFIILWAFPLTAWFWRKRVASPPAPNWAFLDPSPRPLTLPQQKPLRLGRALVVGLVGGGIFLPLNPVLGYGLPYLLGNNFIVLWILNGQVALAVLMQVGVAVIVAGWVKRLGGLHGLFAAFVAACLMTVGVLTFDFHFGGWPILFEQLWFHLGTVFNGGAILALLAAFIVSAIASWFRRHES